MISQREINQSHEDRLLNRKDEIVGQLIELAAFNGLTEYLAYQKLETELMSINHELNEMGVF